jgi:hypothetical protein
VLFRNLDAATSACMLPDITLVPFPPKYAAFNPVENNLVVPARRQLFPARMLGQTIV